MLGTSRAIATMLASVLLVSSALGQPKPPTERQKQRAGELVKQAIAKSQDKDHLAAINLYREAYAVAPLPTLLSNVGTEYQQANMKVEALKYFCLYLDKDPTGALVTYATAQAKVLSSELKISTDANNVCKPPPAPDPGAGPNAGPGSSAASGSGELTGTTGVSATTTTTTSDPGATQKLVGLVGAGVGAVAFTAGIGFGIAAGHISDDISNHKDTAWRNDIRAYQDRGARDEKLQIGFLVGGGVVLVGGVAIYVLGRSKSSAAEHMTVAPSVSPEGGGMTLSGTF